MKRDEVKSIIPEITDDQLNQILNLHGQELTTVKNELKSATEKLGKFDGVDVEALQNSIAELTAEKQAIVFDNTVNNAIERAGGRDVTAIRAMMNIEALKNSEKLEEDLTAALKNVKEAKSWAFNDEAPSKATNTPESQATPAAPAAKVNTGAEHGTAPEDTDDAVIARFKALNPTLKF